jgi:hypothetical protein
LPSSFASVKWRNPREYNCLTRLAQQRQQMRKE